MAGKRAGIRDGARSSLFFEAIRIIKEMREATDGERPRIAVWENVEGAYSSNGGADFGAVLEAFIGIREPGTEVPPPEKGGWPRADVYMGDGWSVAYRLLDAQYWGTPQRRKRIYLVADFAGGGAGEILFKSEGLSAYSADRFNSWKGAARDPAPRAGEAGGGTCLMDQGGQRVGVSEGIAGTLRAEDHGHPPCVMAAGFCTEHSAESRSIGYGDEKAPTLRAGTVPAAVALEHRPNDSRTGTVENEAVQARAGSMGAGGGDVPPVMAPNGPFLPYTLKTRCGREGGGKGALIQEDLSATANDQALFQPAAFGISSDRSHAMLSANPHAGIYEAGTSRTIDASGGTPACNQGGIAVVEPFDIRPASEGTRNARGHCLPAGTSRCLDTGGGCPDPNHGGVAVVGPVAFASNQRNEVRGLGDASGALAAEPGTNQQTYVMAAEPTYSSTCGSYMTSSKEVAQTLMARDYKDPQLVAAAHFTVRRLTPTECARLQGFPDWWCRGLGTPDPTEEDIAFWTGVFEEYRRTVTHASRPKTRNQIVKWLRDPHSDTEEYRLWGNGIALPCAWFVLAGIAWKAGKEYENNACNPARVE